MTYTFHGWDRDVVGRIETPRRSISSTFAAAVVLAVSLLTLAAVVYTVWRAAR